MSHIDDTAEIITDPTAIDCGCSGGCGRMPDEMVITGTAGCAPLCIHCYTRAVREDERRQSAATPPPGTVAALLLKVEEEAKRAHEAEIAEFVSGTSEWSESDKVLYLDGIAHGLRYGAELATATLGAPTPLDRAVREVCALDVGPVACGPFGATVDALNAITDLAMKSGNADGTPDPERNWLRRIVKVGLLALACDAPATKEPG